MSEINNLCDRCKHARKGTCKDPFLGRYGGGNVKECKDFKQAIIKYRQKKSLVIVLQREDQLYNVTVKL